VYVLLLADLPFSHTLLDERNARAHAVITARRVSQTKDEFVVSNIQKEAAQDVLSQRGIESYPE